MIEVTYPDLLKKYKVANVEANGAKDELKILTL